MNKLSALFLILLVVAFLGFIWRRTLGPIERKLNNTILPPNSLLRKINNARYTFQIDYWCVGLILAVVIILIAYFTGIL